MGDFFCSLSLSRRLPASPPLRLVCESLDSIALERVILICCSCVCVSKSESVICCLVFLSSFFSLPRFSSDGKRRLELQQSERQFNCRSTHMHTHRHTLLISRCVFPFCAAANEGRESSCKTHDSRYFTRNLLSLFLPYPLLLMSSRVNVNQPTSSPLLFSRPS